MELYFGKGISEEMHYLHIFVFQEVIGNIKEILRSCYKSSNFIEASLTEKQKEWLLNQTKYNSFSSIGKKQRRYHNLSDWKIYSFFNHLNNYTYVVPFHNRGDIDVYFGNELIEISKHTEKEIYYFWREHQTYGYEIFKGGKVIKSIVEDTHGPEVHVDGKLIFNGWGKYGKPIIGTDLIDGKPIDFHIIKEGLAIKYRYNYSFPFKNEPQFFPPEVFNYLVDNLTKEKGFILDQEKENIIFVNKDLLNVDEHINQVEQLIKANKTGCSVIFWGALIFIAIIVLIALIKGK